MAEYSQHAKASPRSPRNSRYEALLPLPERHRKRSSMMSSEASDHSESWVRVSRAVHCQSQKELETQRHWCWYAIAKRWPLIHAKDSMRLNYWDLWMAFLLAVVAVLSPFETAFLEPHFDTVFLLNRLLDGFFLVDMTLQFFIVTEDNHPDCDPLDMPAIVVKEYIRSWFILDLFSVVPVDLLCMENGFGWAKEIAGLRLVRCLRVVRLLRLARLQRIYERWHTSIGLSYWVISLSKFFFLILISSHWMSCIWAAIGLGGQLHPTWLEALQQEKGGPDEWYQAPQEVYTIALYWAVTTLTGVGYGDVTPQNPREYLVATILMAYMAGIWAYVIGEVCGIVATLQPHEVSFKQTMDDLNELMAISSMPHSMRKRLRKYFHEARDVYRQRVERHILDRLSPKLQGEVALFVHESLVRRVPFLQKLPDRIVVWAARHLNCMVFPPDEEIHRDRTLFLIRRGVCMRHGQVLTTNGIWGTDMLLTNDALRDTTPALALSYVEVLMLHVSDLLAVVEKFPSLAPQLTWERTKIGLIKGVKKIALTFCRIDPALRNTLPSEVRCNMVTDILHDRFTGQVSDYFDTNSSEPEVECPNTMVSRTEGRKMTNKSMNKAPTQTASFRIEDSIGVLTALSETVGNLAAQQQELKRSVADLHMKMDRLLPQGVPMM